MPAIPKKRFQQKRIEKAFMIQSKDISVIVPGSVIQKERLTQRALQSIRTHLPDAEIVLVTWKGQCVEGLSYDTLVTIDDPGANYANTPQGRIPYCNYNRQVSAVCAGLQHATRRFIVKTRNDILFDGSGFLSFYGRFPKRCDSYRLTDERIIVGDILTYHPRRIDYSGLFSVSDFFHFGRREDVELLWAAPLVEDGVRMPFSIEQTLWLSMMQKKSHFAPKSYNDFPPDAAHIYEVSLANNAIVLSHQHIGIRFTKHNYGPVRRLDFCSHHDWLLLYKQYCDPSQHCATYLPKLKTGLVKTGIPIAVRLAVTAVRNTMRRLSQAH